MTALINFIAPLTPAQTGALALAIVAAIVLAPHIIVCGARMIILIGEDLVNTLRHKDEEEFDPAWMDWDKYQQLKGMEQENESVYKSLRRMCREVRKDIPAKRKRTARPALRAVRPVQQVGAGERL